MHVLTVFWNMVATNRSNFLWMLVFTLSIAGLMLPLLDAQNKTILVEVEKFCLLSFGTYHSLRVLGLCPTAK